MKKKFLVALITVSMGMNCITTQAVTIDSKQNTSSENTVIQDSINNGEVKESNIEEIKEGIVPVEAWEGIDSLIRDVEDKTKKSINEVTYEDLRNIDVMNFVGLDRQLPEIVKEFTDLKEVNINYCKNIVTLPDWFYGLSKLEVLSVHWTDVYYLSNDISKLKELKELDLNMINDITLPEEIKDLTKLEKIKFNTIATGNVNHIPDEIYGINSLKELTYSGELTSLSDDILKLDNLEVLNLEYNKLAEIPEQIYKMDKLKKLILSNNEIKNIGDGIHELENLEVINLQFNSLIDFPKQLYKMVNIKNINLNNNQISKISDDISKLSKLEVLNVRDNKLVDLPNTLSDINGESSLNIDARGNYISKIPSLKSDQKIDLCFNFIQCTDHTKYNEGIDVYGFKKLIIKNNMLQVQEDANLESAIENKLIEHHLGYKVVTLKSDGGEEIYDGGYLNTNMEYELVKENGEVVQLNSIDGLKAGEYKFKVKIKGANITNDKAITDEYLTIRINKNTDNGNSGNTEQPGNSNTNNNQNANANNSLSNKGQLPYTGGTDSRNVAGFGVLTTLLGTVLLRRKK